MVKENDKKKSDDMAKRLASSPKVRQARQKMLDPILNPQRRRCAEEEAPMEPRHDDEDIEKSRFKRLSGDQQSSRLTGAKRKLLEEDEIIEQFIKETGKNLDFLLTDVSVDPNDDDPLSWTVSCPAEELNPCYFLILQRAALAVWFYTGEGTQQQRDRVNDRITISRMSPSCDKMRNVKQGGRRGGEYRPDLPWEELLRVMIQERPGLGYTRLWSYFIDKKKDTIIKITSPDGMVHQCWSLTYMPRKKKLKAANLTMGNNRPDPIPIGLDSFKNYYYRAKKITK